MIVFSTFHKYFFFSALLTEKGTQTLTMLYGFPTYSVPLHLKTEVLSLKLNKINMVKQESSIVWKLSTVTKAQRIIAYL